MGVSERPVSYKEFTDILKAFGFFIERQNAGSHEQWESLCFNGERRIVTVSKHHEPYAKALLRSMRNQMGLSKRELFECLGDKKQTQKIATKYRCD